MRALHARLQPALRRRACAAAQRARSLSRCVPCSSACALFPLLGGEFMPQARGGQLLDPRHAADVHLARAVGEVRRPHAPHPPRLPEGPEGRPATRQHRKHPEVHHRRLAARPARRRDRRVGLPQHRVLRAARAVRRVAARADEGQAHRRARQGARRRVPGRRLQLLADDQRQRRGGRVRRQGRELGQGLRHRPRGRTRRTPRDRRRDGRASPGVKDLGMFQLARAAEHQDHARPRARARATASTPATSTPSIQAAIGGQAVTQVYEGEKRFDLTVRWLPAVPRARSRPSARSPSRRPTAATSRSAQIAKIQVVEGPGHHLPRGRRALRAGEVLRARARPRRAPSPRRRPGSPSRSSCPTTRTSSGRARSTSSRRPIGRLADHRPAHAAAHRVPRLQRGEELGRHADRPRRTSRSRAPGGVLALLITRHQLLGLGGDGVHLHLRHRHAGRHPGRHVLPAAARVGRAAPSRSRRARRPRSASARC